MLDTLSRQFEDDVMGAPKDQQIDAYIAFALEVIQLAVSKKIKVVQAGELLKKGIHLEEVENSPQLSLVTSDAGKVSRTDLDPGSWQDAWKSLQLYVNDWVIGKRYPTFWYLFANYGIYNAENRLTQTVTVDIRLTSSRRLNAVCPVSAIKQMIEGIQVENPAGSDKEIYAQVYKNIPHQINEYRCINKRYDESLVRGGYPTIYDEALGRGLH